MICGQYWKLATVILHILRPNIGRILANTGYLKSQFLEDTANIECLQPLIGWPCRLRLPLCKRLFAQCLMMGYIWVRGGYLGEGIIVVRNNLAYT